MPEDLEERKAEWELEVEPPAVRENSADLCARPGADHVAIDVFHLAAARRKRARRIDGERLLQRRKAVAGGERRRAGKGLRTRIQNHPKAAGPEDRPRREEVLVREPREIPVSDGAGEHMSNLLGCNARTVILASKPSRAMPTSCCASSWPSSQRLATRTGPLQRPNRSYVTDDALAHPKLARCSESKFPCITLEGHVDKTS